MKQEDIEKLFKARLKKHDKNNGWIFHKILSDPKLTQGEKLNKINDITKGWM